MYLLKCFQGKFNAAPTLLEKQQEDMYGRFMSLRKRPFLNGNQSNGNVKNAMTAASLIDTNVTAAVTVLNNTVNTLNVPNYNLANRSTAVSTVSVVTTATTTTIGSVINAHPIDINGGIRLPLQKNNCSEIHTSAVPVNKINKDTKNNGKNNKTNEDNNTMSSSPLSVEKYKKSGSKETHFL